MKKTFRYGLVAMMITLGASFAQAQFVLNPNVTYTSDKTEGDAGDGESSRFSLDLRAGFVGSSGLFLGGTYGYEALDFGAGDDAKFSSIAPTVGYFGGNFLAMLSYHFIAETDFGPGKYTEGAGPQVDVGYVLPVNSNFAIGPQLRWRSIEYGKVEAGGGEMEASITRTSLEPMVNLWFTF